MSKLAILLLLAILLDTATMYASPLAKSQAAVQQQHLYAAGQPTPRSFPMDAPSPHAITSLPLPPDESLDSNQPTPAGGMHKLKSPSSLDDIASPFTRRMTNPRGNRLAELGGSSPQWTILVLLTFLTLIPSLLICMTPFARLLIVFHFLRQALGLQTTPSNQTLVGLSLIMTFFLMQPVGEAIYHDSIVPLQAGQVNAMQALELGLVPMRHFMAPYIREKDAELFLEIAHEPRPKNIDDLSFRVLLPAYIVSELKSGFQIGAVLFLPFLVVDMVVASIISSVGMMQLPPVVISTPLKLLLFLMVDGWHLLIGSLMRSFS